MASPQTTTTFIDRRTPNRGIYPFWDDLRLTEHGDVYTHFAGSLPGPQVLSVQWDDVGTFDDSTAWTS